MRTKRLWGVLKRKNIRPRYINEYIPYNAPKKESLGLSQGLTNKSIVIITNRSVTRSDAAACSDASFKYSSEENAENAERKGNADSLRTMSSFKRVACMHL